MHYTNQIKNKFSIKNKLNLVTIGIIIIMFFMTIVPISILYEPYYISEQKDVLKSIYGSFSYAVNTMEDFRQKVFEAEINDHINILILNSNYTVEYSTLSSNLNNNYFDEYDTPVGYLEPNNDVNTYQIFRTTNKYSGVENLHLIFTFKMDNSLYYVILESPIINIGRMTKSLIIFILSCMIPLSIITSVIVSLVSGFIISPIVKLSNLSERLAQFEFDTDINIYTNDEIGILAQNMKTLSSELQEKWTDLNNKNRLLELSLKEKDKNAKIQREFISNVSHELKTPITLILGYSEALGMDIDEETKKEYISIIISESHKMNNLITDMLDISRLQSGDKKLDTEELDFSALLNKTVSKHKITFEKNKINLSVDIDDGCKVVGDKSKLELVISNFIVNAIRYVDEKKTIKVSLKKEENMHKFSIFNTAKHFSDDDVKKIWGSFYKIDKAHSREKGGTGIGLYLVKVILELHGFEYGVKNVDDGVEFFIMLK